MTQCRICFREDETRNINLYVFGSEGVDACHSCEMAIVNLIREISSVAGRAKMAAMKRNRAAALKGETATRKL